MPDAPKIEVRPAADDVARLAADRFVSLAERTLDVQETFTVGLAGGSTPKAMYELLASDEYKNKVEWARVEIFFGDERTVGPDHPDSNFAMAKAALLDHVGVPGDNLYRMKGELEPAEAAAAYDALLKDKFGTDAGDPGLDLLLLGMGDDAHTLSLFPETEALTAGDDRLCVANHVPQKDTWRITLTAAFANRSRHVDALIVGKAKAGALNAVLEGDHDPRHRPMQLIAPTMGSFTILADIAATDMDEA